MINKLKTKNRNNRLERFVFKEAVCTYKYVYMWADQKVLVRTFNNRGPCIIPRCSETQVRASVAQASAQEKKCLAQAAFKRFRLVGLTGVLLLAAFSSWSAWLMGRCILWWVRLVLGLLVAVVSRRSGLG